MSSLPKPNEIHIERLNKSYASPGAYHLHYIIQDVDLVVKGENFLSCLGRAAAGNPPCSA